MSWLRNSQVSLVALAVSAAVGLAACGGVESDRESGESSSIYSNPVLHLKDVIAPEGEPVESAFSAIAGNDMVLSFEEANNALKNHYKADKGEEYLRANSPKESSYDADGNGKLEGAELTAYNQALSAVETAAAAYVAALSTDAVVLFGSEAEFVAAFDKNADQKIEASDLDVPLIPEVTYNCGSEVATDNDNVYIIGGFTRVGADQWKFGSQCKMAKAGDIYSITLDLTGNPIKPISFKFANAGWGGPINCGGGETKVVTLGQAFTGGCGNSSTDLSLIIPTAGQYKFELNSAGGGAVVTVTKQ